MKAKHVIIGVGIVGALVWIYTKLSGLKNALNNLLVTPHWDGSLNNMNFDLEGITLPIAIDFGNRSDQSLRFQLIAFDIYLKGTRVASSQPNANEVTLLPYKTTSLRGIRVKIPYLSLLSTVGSTALAYYKSNKDAAVWGELLKTATFDITMALNGTIQERFMVDMNGNATVAGLRGVPTDKRVIRSLDEYIQYIPPRASLQMQDKQIVADVEPEYTASFIRKMAQVYRGDTTELARRLAGGSVRETIRHIWDFVAYHIRYVPDRSDMEQVRRPLRALYEQRGDCDCYSCLIASILENLGIPYVVRIAEYNHKGYYKNYNGDFFSKHFDGGTPSEPKLTRYRGKFGESVHMDAGNGAWSPNKSGKQGVWAGGGAHILSLKLRHVKAGALLNAHPCTSLDMEDCEILPIVTDWWTGTYKLAKGCTSLQSVRMRRCKTGADIAQMFLGCTNLTDVDIDLIDTGATSAELLFHQCSSLRTIDLSFLSGLTHLTAINSLLNSCSSLTSVDLTPLSGLTGLTIIGSLLSGCTGLTSIDLSPLASLTNVTNLSGLFYNCTGLTSIDLSPLASLTNVTTLENLLYGCSGLSAINLNPLAGMTGVTTLKGLLQGCSGLTSIDLTPFRNYTEVTDVSYLFSGLIGLQDLSLTVLAKRTETVNGETITYWGKVTNIAHMFENLYLGRFASFDVSQLSDWDNITEVTAMYKGCRINKADFSFLEKASFRQYPALLQTLWPEQNTQVKISGLQEIEFGDCYPFRGNGGLAPDSLSVWQNTLYSIGVIHFGSNFLTGGTYRDIRISTNYTINKWKHDSVMESLYYNQAASYAGTTDANGRARTGTRDGNSSVMQILIDPNVISGVTASSGGYATSDPGLTDAEMALIASLNIALSWSNKVYVDSVDDLGSTFTQANEYYVNTGDTTTPVWTRYVKSGDNWEVYTT